MNGNQKFLWFASVVIVTGVGLAWANIKDDTTKQTNAKAHNEAKHEHAEGEASHHEDMIVVLTPAQIKKYDIQTFTIDQGDFQQKLSFPSEVTLNENKVTHIVALVPGVVKDIYKNLGEAVKPNERLVSIQSREMAEAKAAYLAAFKDLELKMDLFKREEKLWDMKVKAEIEYIKVKNILETAKIQLEQTRQKLLALGMTEKEITQLPNEKGPLNLYYIDSPIDGVVIERHLTRGEVIDKDKQIYVLANLDTVWVTLAVGAKDLRKIRKGQKVTISSNNDEVVATSEIMYVSPMINEESRSGKAIVELDNVNNKWHPGDFVKTEIVIASDKADVNLTIPVSAIQKINGEPYAFVRNDQGFIAKKLAMKASKNNDYIQVESGLTMGDEIAVTNTFLLKAELGKSEAEHSH